MSSTTSFNPSLRFLSCAEARELREKTIVQTRDLARKEATVQEEQKRQRQLSCCLERIQDQASRGYNFAYCENSPFVATQLLEREYHVEKRPLTANIEHERFTYKGLHDLEILTSFEKVHQTALFVFWGDLPAPRHRNTVDLIYSPHFDIFQCVTWAFTREEKSPLERT